METHIFEKVGFPVEQLAGMKGIIESQITLGLTGQAEELAKAALFLACNDASFITGIELAADGGLFFMGKSVCISGLLNSIFRLPKPSYFPYPAVSLAHMDIQKQ